MASSRAPQRFGWDVLSGVPLLLRWLFVGLLALGGVGIGYCAAGSKTAQTQGPASEPTPTTTPAPAPAPSVPAPVLVIWDYAPGVPDHTGFSLRQCEVGPDQQCTMQIQEPVLAADVRSVEVPLPQRPRFVCVEVVVVFRDESAAPSNRVCLGH